MKLSSPNVCTLSQDYDILSSVYISITFPTTKKPLNKYLERPDILQGFRHLLPIIPTTPTTYSNNITRF